MMHLLELGEHHRAESDDGTVTGGEDAGVCSAWDSVIV
jgi:hypothetical protein